MLVQLLRQVIIILKKRFISSGCFFIFITTFSMGHARVIEDNTKEEPLDTKAICQSVKNVLIPSHDLPDEANRQALKKCDPESLYFGFGNAPDYINAQKCALIKRHNGLLAMIYANGKGVKIDFDMAIHFACLMETTSAEMEARIHRLYNMKTSKNSKIEFNLCDDMMTGYMMGYCVVLMQRAQEPEHKKVIDDIKAKLKSTELVAFKKLQYASKNYFKARVEYEIEGWGIAAFAYNVVEEMRLNDRMLDVVKKIEQCEIPIYTTAQYRNADRQLNIIYKEVLKPKDSEGSTIRRQGIKKTERAWIKYRDSWSDFGQIKCPNISHESWVTLITKERVKELKERTRE